MRRNSSHTRIIVWSAVALLGVGAGLYYFMNEAPSEESLADLIPPTVEAPVAPAAPAEALPVAEASAMAEAAALSETLPMESAPVETVTAIEPAAPVEAPATSSGFSLGAGSSGRAH